MCAISESQVEATLKGQLCKLSADTEIISLNGRSFNGICKDIETLGIKLNKEKEASLIITKYFEQFPGIQNYINDTLDGARQNKYVKTIFGRRRPIWDVDSANGIKKKAAERVAINMPIQGSAAEMIKVAMIAIQEKINKLGMKSKLILQIHDELIFESPASEEEILIKMVVEKMENAMKLSVPIVVDYGSGSSWLKPTKQIWKQV